MSRRRCRTKLGGGASLTNLRLACLPALPTPFSSSCTMEVSQLTTAQYSNLHSYYALSFSYVSALYFMLFIRFWRCTWAS